jgi:hypothetical protein
MHDPKDFHRREEIDEEMRASVLGRVYLEILSWPDPAEKKAANQVAQKDDPGTPVESGTPGEGEPDQDKPAQGQSSQGKSSQPNHSSELHKEV